MSAQNGATWPSWTSKAVRAQVVGGVGPSTADASLMSTCALSTPNPDDPRPPDVRGFPRGTSSSGLASPGSPRWDSGGSFGRGRRVPEGEGGLHEPGVGQRLGVVAQVTGGGGIELLREEAERASEMERVGEKL